MTNLLGFLLISTNRSWAWCWISVLLDSSLQSNLSWDPSKKILEHHKVGFSNIMAWDPAFCLFFRAKVLQEELFLPHQVLCSRHAQYHWSYSAWVTLIHKLSWLIFCAKTKLNTTTLLSHLKDDSFSFYSQPILPKNSASIQDNLVWEKPHKVSCATFWPKQSQLWGQNCLLKSFSAPVLKTSIGGACTNSCSTCSAAQLSSWWNILISNLKIKYIALVTFKILIW